MDSAINLADGRRVAYTEWGVPGGIPVVFCHGGPHSRLFCPDEPVTVEAGVRLIIPDRPGVGGSDVLEAYRIGDWPRDVIGVADALGIERFAVVGWSAGGPYAAACAALIPSRLTGAAIVSSRHLSAYNFVERPESYEELDADDRATYDLAQTNPKLAAKELARQWGDVAARIRTDPESYIDVAGQPEGDRWFFADESRARPFYAAIAESVRQGIDIYSWALIDGWFPWGFRLAEIPMRVHFWHGAEDPRVPQKHVDFTVGHIPDCVLTTWPGVGHFGIARYWGQVLAALAPG